MPQAHFRVPKTGAKHVVAAPSSTLHHPLLLSHSVWVSGADSESRTQRLPRSSSRSATPTNSPVMKSQSRMPRLVLPVAALACTVTARGITGNATTPETAEKRDLKPSKPVRVLYVQRPLACRQLMRSQAEDNRHFRNVPATNAHARAHTPRTVRSHECTQTTEIEQMLGALVVPRTGG
jgi:hypothetical protein